MFKSKLQQLCQQNYWPLPKYSWLKEGPDHSPAFKASVLVNDHSFDSVAPFKSSKEAQNDAAMHAFFKLATLPSDAETEEDEPMKRKLKNKGADHSSKVLGNVLITNFATQVDAIKKAGEREIKNYVNAMTPMELQGKMAELTVADSSDQTTCQSSYLLSNRVRVYTTISDIEFPRGITLIPVADNKWVPVCLEFPNEKSV